MPPTFPSHQGLIAPLWRRWPHLFDMPALCVGAAMPDVVDGVIGAFRGHLCQDIGHSLVGLFLLCLPGGLLLWRMLHWTAAHVPTSVSQGYLSRAWNMGIIAVREAQPSSPFIEYWRRIIVSVFLGAVSHLFFDVISHGKCLLLYPWLTNIPIYPAWWHVAWARISLPLYRSDHPVGPHALVWLLLAIIGVFMLFRPVSQKKNRPGAPSDNNTNRKV